MTRPLVLAAFVGVAVSSLTGSDLFGAVAAIIAVGLVLLAGRLFPGRATGAACALESGPRAQVDPADTPRSAVR